jgi:hypothetical protein
MRNSCNIVHRLSVALLAATLLGATAYAQEAVTGRSQPSMDSSEPFSGAATPSSSSPAQPSEGSVAAKDAVQPTAEVTTLASPQTTTSTSPSISSDDELHDKKWHIYGTAYLWVPRMGGTVGVRGYDTNIDVSTGDIFSNFRGGILGVFTPTYGRFSAPVDVLWMRLRPSKQVPYVPAEGDDTQYYVRALLNESIITPKLAYLAVDTPKVRIYATAGARIWHIGTTLSLYPSTGGPSPYAGVTWIDYVMGGRFNIPLGTKASVDILGDGGEGGATLDYQVAGVINYKIKPKMTAQIGWRYLTEHYGNNGNIQNTTTQGILFGATYQFK